MKKEPFFNSGFLWILAISSAVTFSFWVRLPPVWNGGMPLLEFATKLWVLPVWLAVIIRDAIREHTIRPRHPLDEYKMRKMDWVMVALTVLTFAYIFIV